jgi:predicted  nucleic acid-binding Zn-ribbon protein
MSSLSEDLAELHGLLLELEEVEEMLSSGPRKVAAQQRVADKKQAECEQQKAHITDLRKASDEKSLQLKTNEAKIVELNGKLNVAASNREYEIIKSQIEANTMANSVLEDEILESLEKVDAAVQDLNELEKLHEESVAKQKKTAAEVAESASGLQSKCDELNGQIGAVEKRVPTSAKDAYVRLRGAYGAAALSAIEGGACTQCYSELSPQHRVTLNLGKVLFCQSCARLMYRVQ